MKTIAKKIYLALICIILYAPIVTLMVLSLTILKHVPNGADSPENGMFSLFQNKEIMMH